MKLLLIDGNSIMNRGYFALPNTLTAKNGIHTNAVLGFLNIFYKVYDEEKPDHIIVAFDMHAPTFRHKMYAEYKGTRKGMDPELREQFPLIKDILDSMSIPHVEVEGYEADDIIGTYSRQGMSRDMEVTILSGDRDLLQLATDKVLVRIPKTKGGKTTVEDYYAKDVIEEYGVTPVEFIEMKGLMGDSSDNIPGVSGIGPKTASQIIQKYHSIEAALQDIDNIMPNKAREHLDAEREMALFSRDLATIKLDCELDFSILDKEITRSDIFSQSAYNLYKELDLKSQLKRFDGINMDEPSAHGVTIQIEPEDISYADLLQIINTSDESAIGFGAVFIDNTLMGGAVSVGDKVYIVNDYGISGLRQNVRPDICICFLSVKEYISSMDLKESDSLFDASVAAYLLKPLASEYSYDYIAGEFLDIELESEKDLVGKNNFSKFSFMEESFRKLIAYKAAVALRSRAVLCDELGRLSMLSLYKDIEYPTIFVLNKMERYGVSVDRKSLEEYGARLGEEYSRVEEEIYELAGERFNIKSTKQLGVILFEKLGLKSGKKTKSGYSTNVDVLNKLKDEHPIIPLILRYRSLGKLISTYIEGLLECIKSDGKIHTKFNQTVTATGRLSSTDPNLQNIPTRTEEGREIRKAFVPEKGYTFVDADYSQIELRVMASISGDEALIEAFNSSKDIHAITASQVFGVPLEEVDSGLRRRAKAVNFGIIYGISSFGLGEDLGISRSEAKEYIDKYFETYHKVKEYLDNCVSDAKSSGAVKTSFGRIRPIPEISSSNFMTRSFGERVAMNSPIQGTAADIIKIAMINVDRELQERGLKSRLILQIHDELLIETALDEVETVKELLKRNMEGAADLAVKLLVDVHTGESLYDAK